MASTPRPRLLEVARAVAAAAGLDAVFALGDAASLPVPDGLLVVADSSPEAHVDAELANHPGWVEARKLLEPLGRWENVRADLVLLFADANEDPDALRITSRYVVATVTA